jgi:uncharacterized protein YndB with AHSA1/START domain
MERLERHLHERSARPIEKLAGKPATHELRITRTFNAPRELVWRAWTDPEMAKQWSGPKQFPAFHMELGKKPGDRWRIGLRGCAPGTDTPVEIWQGGILREFVPPKRLVYTYAWENRASVGLPEDGEPHETVITVRLEEHAGKTTMHFHQAFFATAAERDGHNGGWSSPASNVSKNSSTRKPPRRQNEHTRQTVPMEMELTRTFRAPRARLASLDRRRQTPAMVGSAALHQPPLRDRPSPRRPHPHRHARTRRRRLSHGRRVRADRSARAPRLPHLRTRRAGRAHLRQPQHRPLSRSRSRHRNLHPHSRPSKDTSRHAISSKACAKVGAAASTSSLTSSKSSEPRPERNCPIPSQGDRHENRSAPSIFRPVSRGLRILRKNLQHQSLVHDDLRRSSRRGTRSARR